MSQGSLGHNFHFIATVFYIRRGSVGDNQLLYSVTISGKESGLFVRLAVTDINAH